MRPLPLLLALAWLAAPMAHAEHPWSVAGHAKYRFLNTNYPEDSVANGIIGDHAIDHVGDVRLELGLRKNAWQARADAQWTGRHGDVLEGSRQLGDLGLMPAPMIDDDRRLIDLTDVISDGDEYVLLQRLDRLFVGYAGNRGVVRFGRQALSWGNGLIYTPMDFFNPFDPASVDKEYKTGDDMAYGQLLRANGDDLQAVWVGRRNPESGDVESDVLSSSLKYHGFVGGSEYDLLAAHHFGDWILGVGGIHSLGGTILRGDITITWTDSDTVVNLVANGSYSWVLWGKNVSGVLEYYYNGFGLEDDEMNLFDLAENPDLLSRFERGELFTLGRHYLAASATVELNPLWNLTPTLFWNMGDRSGMVQLTAQYDIFQNCQILASANFPFGSGGSEYGGIETGVAELEIASNTSVFLQLAWYF